MQTPELSSDPVFHDEEVGGASMGRGWWYCGSCQDKFTVRVGAIFERSHIPLHKWLLAYRLMASSKKGVSATRALCVGHSGTVGDGQTAGGDSMPRSAPPVFFEHARTRARVNR